MVAWPASGDAKEELGDMKLSHVALPLPVYNVDGSFVEPSQVVSVLRNSIVEVHFSLKHYAIRENGTAKFDTFTAIIQQIMVLVAARPKAKNPYRRTLRAGPIKLLPAIVLDATSAVKGPLVAHGETEKDAAVLVYVDAPGKAPIPGESDNKSDNGNLFFLILLST